jgi:Zn-finger nucleic acid-binding protein
MSSVTIGSTAMRECEQCDGLWVEAGAFEQICADREQQSAVLGTAAAAHAVSPAVTTNRITYAPCPQCGQLMNRLNFARCSGVIVDLCKGHGTWFDRDELREIVEFVRGGGLETSRQKEKIELEAARAQLRQEQLAAANASELRSIYHSDDDRLNGLSSASGLLRFLLK